MTKSVPPQLVIPQWDNLDRNIVRIDLFTGWDWEMFERSQQQVFQMIEAVAWPVDVIINTTHANAPPPDIVVRPRLLAQKRHPRIRHTVVVLNARHKHTAFNLMVRLDTTQRFKTWLVANDLEEARSLLRK
jgi:hypothetical protein